ncbi:PREDICTED: DNA polymerase kappa isoform X3 [Nelumbo nucifera]|uniref:DNA polymerase kappa n=1 Tax=Nelumbo nucifera TaxID=4432 RepID=A0A1U7Z4Y5_NELNU|nr:PREDICTED: DNA polymerase kappa isoform X3 [Nelumbo nucifera]
MQTGETSEQGARPWLSYHTVYTNAKAGMDGVDKEKVQRIIYETSKGSKYFENEERKEEFIRQKIENMRIQCAKLTAMDISHYQGVADKRISELEAARDLSKIWLHVDMDAFYAAVETLENPSLKGKPMAVGSMSMISTANYEARKFGVRAAMPGFIARKLCPDLIFVHTNFKKYAYYSELTRKVFQKYDPNFMATSLDEAYLDITEVCKEKGSSSEEIAEELRKGVYEETGLTCSAGVAPNRLLAKVCSDINKPNGQFILPNDRMAIMTFISSLPIRKIGGIGKVTEHILRNVLGINTCEDMLQKSAFLFALFSRSSTDFFLSAGLGLGGTDSPQVKLRKSISSERTFSATEDKELLYQKLADIAETLSNDMQQEGLRGRTLTLKLKTATYEVRTRAVSLQKYICSSEDILDQALKLLKSELPLSLRLIGLRMSHFDKLGPADPMQKTLTSFVISRNTCEKATSCSRSLGADASDNCTMCGTETGLSTDDHEIHLLDPGYDYNSMEPYQLNQLSCSDDEGCTPSNDAGEMKNLHTLMSSKCPSKLSQINTPDLVEFHDTDKLQKVEVESVAFFGKSKGNSVDQRNKRGNLFYDKTVLSFSQEGQTLWVDGYKCSLCGVELPPSFVEERQEHSDYHLAEMLQKEESESNSRDLMLVNGSIQKAKSSGVGKRKKQKSHPKDGKHIPIDVAHGGQDPGAKVEIHSLQIE